MLKVSIGWSDEPDTLEATDVAMEMAVKALDGQVPQAALVYVSIDLDMDVVSQTLREVSGHTGCGLHHGRRNCWW